VGVRVDEARGDQAVRAVDAPRRLVFRVYVRARAYGENAASAHGHGAALDKAARAVHGDDVARTPDGVDGRWESRRSGQGETSE